MHYIRILKAPRLTPTLPPCSNPRSQSLITRIAITTDLGDAFLCARVKVFVCLSIPGSVLGSPLPYTWKGDEGMRSLDVQIPLRMVPATRDMVRVVVYADDGASEDYPKICSDDFSAVLPGWRFRNEALEQENEDEARVIGVTCMPFSLTTRETKPSGLAERSFAAGRGRTIRIWEETGESIARHIWDAGVVLSAYLANVVSPSHHNSGRADIPKLPLLNQTLERHSLNVLELGAGCGIVGITLSAHFPNIEQLVLTDLPEASEIIEHNLALPIGDSSLQSEQVFLENVSHQVLDWAEPLPVDIARKKWELVVIADCTYNPDVVPDLVTTLERLRDCGEGGGEMKVLLAMKVRHESEMVFFELMKKAGFEILEKGKIAVGVLGAEGEEIEIFVFA